MTNEGTAAADIFAVQDAITSRLSRDPEPCWSCRGRGWRDWRCLGPDKHEYVICTTCNGTGKLLFVEVVSADD